VPLHVGGTTYQIPRRLVRAVERGYIDLSTLTPSSR
jgi:hypothetical protein